MEVELLIAAYRQGFFPMAASRRARSIEWFNPARRAVIPLDGVRVPRSLRQRARSGRFDVRADTCFEEVVRACAARGPGRGETWINAEIVSSYAALHAAGHAHSVEAFAKESGELVGGLYGVSIGGAFFGESMFTRAERGGTDASKVCFLWLVEHLRRRGYLLLDAQVLNPHTASLGAIEIPRAAYLARLAGAIDRGVTWGEWALS